VDTNLNTNWLENKASWLFYTMLVVAGWLIVSNFVDPGDGMVRRVVVFSPLASARLCSPLLASAPLLARRTRSHDAPMRAGRWCIYVTGW
jgi:hypothetical protein